jgi:hypothetical protein
VRKWIIAVLLFAPLLASAQRTHLTAREAKDHVGETQTVCGKVVSTRYASGSKGQPTFLNLDEPYPKEIFTILIWGNARTTFGRPETEYRDKDVCVTSKITSYRGTPEIVATESSQVALQNPSLPTDKHGKTAPTPTYHLSNGVAYCEDWVLNKDGEWEDHVSKCPE